MRMSRMSDEISVRGTEVEGGTTVVKAGEFVSAEPIVAETAWD